MLTIYHNPRCRKSREGHEILDNSGKEFEVVKYLEDTLTVDELSKLIKLLGIAPIDLVRKNEKDWKEHFKGKDLSDAEVIEAMVAYPKLMERPIVVHGNKAVIGRPPEIIKTIL